MSLGSVTISPSHLFNRFHCAAHSPFCFRRPRLAGVIKNYFKLYEIVFYSNHHEDHPPPHHQQRGWLKDEVTVSGRMGLRSAMLIRVCGYSHYFAATNTHTLAPWLSQEVETQ